MKSTLTALAAGTALLALTTPAMAQNVALVIGNADYSGVSDLSDREHDRLVSAYRSAGFEVTEGENLTRTQLFTLLGGFLDTIEGAERIVIHLNGHTVTTQTESWFMPTDTNGDTVVRIGLTAPTLDLFLSMVDGASEVGVLFVGTDEENGHTGEGYDTGVGRIYAPRDTMVVVGPIADVSSLVRNTALEPGTTLREMGNELPDDLRRFGFAPRNVVLVEEREVVVEPLPQITPQPQPSVPQVSPAERQEADLNLTRAQRREIQTDLVALGYNTRGIDGLFGAGSRSAIAAWQQAQSFTATGFLSRGQIDLLGVQADNKRAADEAERTRAQAEREREERAFWEATGAAGTEQGLRRYLDSYPNGIFAAQARTELAALTAANAGAQVAAAWETAVNTNTIAGYETFLANFPQSEFAGTARARIEQLRAAQAPAPTPAPATDPLAEARAAEQALGLNSINRALVQIRLQALGYTVGNISGSFDEATRQGLAAFQRDYGLEATGYVNQATVRQLITLSGQ